MIQERKQKMSYFETAHWQDFVDRMSQNLEKRNTLLDEQNRQLSRLASAVEALSGAKQAGGGKNPFR